LVIPLFAQEFQSPRAYIINPWFPAKFGEGRRHHGVGLGAYCGIGGHREWNTCHVNFPEVWFVVTRTSTNWHGCTITTSIVKDWT